MSVFVSIKKGKQEVELGVFEYIGSETSDCELMDRCLLSHYLQLSMPNKPL